eukprot:170078-Prymnesium_polylepis.1
MLPPPADDSELEVPPGGSMAIPKPDASNGGGGKKRSGGKKGKEESREAPRGHKPAEKLWSEAELVQASVEARASAGSAIGAPTHDATDVPLPASELRRNPALIGGAAECAALRLVTHEVDELRQ